MEIRREKVEKQHLNVLYFLNAVMIEIHYIIFILV